MWSYTRSYHGVTEILIPLESWKSSLMKYKILTPSLCLSLTHIQITKHNGSEPVSGTGVCCFTSSCQWKGECCLLYVFFISFHLLLLWCMYSPHVGVKWAAASRDEKLNQCQTALPIAARLALNAKVVKANVMLPIDFGLCTLLVYFGARNYVTWVKALSAIRANVCSLCVCMYVYIYIYCIIYIYCFSTRKLHQGRNLGV